MLGLRHHVEAEEVYEDDGALRLAFDQGHSLVELISALASVRAHLFQDSRP